MFFKAIFKAIFCRQAKRMDVRELMRKLEEQRKEARNHLSVPLLDAYGVWPERLTAEKTQIVELHLSGCDRCKKQVQGLRERLDFYRRQGRKEPCD